MNQRPKQGRGQTKVDKFTLATADAAVPIFQEITKLLLDDSGGQDCGKKIHGSIDSALNT